MTDNNDGGRGMTRRDRMKRLATRALNVAD